MQIEYEVKFLVNKYENDSNNQNYILVSESLFKEFSIMKLEFKFDEDLYFSSKRLNISNFLQKLYNTSISYLIKDYAIESVNILEVKGN